MDQIQSQINSIEFKRLESELKFSQQQLASAIESKCSAITKYEETQHKMLEINFKEQRMNQEKILMQNQLEILKNDLNRNIQEFQQFRVDSSNRCVSLEAKYHEKCEELNIALLQSSQLKESNEILSEKVKEFSKQILSLNEEFSISKKKYLAELTAKSRLIELYKEKSQDSDDHHREMTDAMTILRSALKEASEEFSKLAMKNKNDEMQHKIDMEAIKSELNNANCLLNSCINDNFENGQHSVSSVYNNYINAMEDIEKLSIEHEELKEKFSNLFNEVNELRPMKNLKIKYEQSIEQKEEAEKKIEKLENSLKNCEKKLDQNHQDRIAMNHQIYSLLSVIEGRKVSGETRTYDFILHNFGTYKDIEELQENNLKLMHIVKELSVKVDELEKMKIDRENLEISSETTQTASSFDSDSFESITEKIMQDQVTQTCENSQEIKMENFIEIQTKNLQLLAKIEDLKNQLELYEKNHEMAQKMIQNLSEKNSKFSSTISKLEENLNEQKIENQETKLKLQNSQNSLEKLEKENQKLILTAVEEKAKFDAQLKISQSSNHMMTNLEFIRASIERIESEGSAKIMQQQLENERKNFISENEKLKDEILRFSKVSDQKSQEIQNLTEKSQKDAENFEKKLKEIQILKEKLEKFEQKSTRNVEIQVVDTESEQEMTKLKENLAQRPK
ncbi:hypothetical protein PVAND_016159 [Polypedilum vanderplanki]|uniref:Uncharacterized protein n=2 Tax=Polypedilum vanderplanki TaxID=319348 RepID=A0A9J6BES2_POLVA|nr:hypothetical protein PVAND_016159 [Polypedilum vanderplanki]